MDNSLLVGRFERLCDLSCNWQRFIERNRPACDAVGERVAVNALQHKRVDVAAVLQSMDCGDVRMVQRGEYLRLPVHAGEAFSICGKPCRQNLQRDVTAEFRIPRPVDLSHSACADRGNNLVRTEPSTWGEGHFFCE